MSIIRSIGNRGTIWGMEVKVRQIGQVSLSRNHSSPHPPETRDGIISSVEDLCRGVWSERG